MIVNNFHYRWHATDQMVPLFAGKQLLYEAVILIVSFIKYSLQGQ